MAFSPDAKAIVSASADNTLKLWNPKSGKCLRTLKGHGSHVLGVAFSPDAKAIVTGSRDRSVRVWDAATGAELAQLWFWDDDWLVIAPDGSFDASPVGWDCLGFQHGQCIYPSTEFKWLHEPGLLGRILKASTG